MNDHIIRVLIADDHQAIRDGVRSSVEAHQQMRIIGMAATFAEVLEFLSSTPIDVVVLDLSGMGGAPIKLVERLRWEHPQVAIVVFSSSSDLAPELLRAGVSGYVVKEAPSEQLVDAIQAAHEGQCMLSPGVEEYLRRIHESRREYQLAPQEILTLKLLAQGLATIEIAAQMGIDPRSVRNYLTSVRRKTGCIQRIQLVDWYRRHYEVDEATREQANAQ